MTQTSTKIGLIQEDAVKRIFEEQGWTVNVALSTGKPIDIYASYEGRLGILCEVKNNDPDYPFAIPVFSKKVYKAGDLKGTFYPMDLSQIWRANEVLKKLQRKKAIYRPYLKVVVCNKQKNGVIAYNQYYNIFFIEYRYFPIWLRIVPKVFLPDPSFMFNLE